MPIPSAPQPARRAFMAEYRGWPVVVAAVDATAARTAAIRAWRGFFQAPVPWLEVRVRRAKIYDLWARQAAADTPEEPCNCRVTEEQARRIVEEMTTP